MKSNTKYSLILIAFILIIGVLFLTFLTNLQKNKTFGPPVSPPPSDDSGLTDVPIPISISGTYICLPHGNGDGPVTMECAFGLQGEDGAYYALDTSNATNRQPVDYPTGITIKVTGMLVPIEQISSDIWQKYNIKGIIAASEIKQL